MRLLLSTTFYIIATATALASFPSVQADSDPLNSGQALQAKMDQEQNWSGSSKLVRRYRRLPPRPPSVAIDEDINCRTYCNKLATKITSLSLLFEANFEKWAATRSIVAESTEILQEPNNNNTTTTTTTTTTIITDSNLLTDVIHKKDRLVIAVSKTVGAYDFAKLVHEELEAALVVVRGALELFVYPENGESFVLRSAALQNINGMRRDESELVSNGCLLY